MFDLFMELFDSLFVMLMKVLFIAYLILLIIMLISGPGFLLFECIFILIGFFGYSKRCKKWSFPVSWMSATMCGVACFILGPIIGMILAPIVRLWLIFKD